MLKVTLKFSFYCVIILAGGCREPNQKLTEFEMEQQKDSVAEARIDSAYAAIKSQCDTLMVYQVPEMVDSLLKDSTLLLHFFDTGKRYTDANEKVEKVVRQLQADCDSSLLRETYRRALLQQRSKPKPHSKRKS